jgi:hypothetical protein
MRTKDWERPPSPTIEELVRRKNVQEAIDDIQKVVQGQTSDLTLTRSLAIILLEVLSEVRRTSRDAEYAMIGVRALLKALSEENDYLKDFLSGKADVHRRGADPSLRRHR